MMDDVEGKLCDTCIATLQGKARPYDEEFAWAQQYIHHEKYSDFEASKDMECFICIWLWAKHQPPPPNTDVSGNCSALDGFQVLCHIGNFLKYSITASFEVTCPWAIKFELQGTSNAIPNVERRKSPYGN